MNVTTVKNRTLQEGQKVKVYFNLHKKLFSIKDYKTGLVVAYSPIINLKDCEFKVSEAGRQRVLREKQKNIHAYVIGVYVSDREGSETAKANYNPYKYSSFVDSQEQPLKKACSVTCINKQVRYSA